MFDELKARSSSRAAQRPGAASGGCGPADHRAGTGAATVVAAVDRALTAAGWAKCAGSWLFPPYDVIRITLRVTPQHTIGRAVAAEQIVFGHDPKRTLIG